MDRSDDLFIPPNELNGAMQGEVLVDALPVGGVGEWLDAAESPTVGIMLGSDGEVRGRMPMWCGGHKTSG